MLKSPKRISVLFSKEISSRNRVRMSSLKSSALLVVMLNFYKFRFNFLGSICWFIKAWLIKVFYLFRDIEKGTTFTFAWGMLYKVDVQKTIGQLSWNLVSVIPMALKSNPSWSNSVQKQLNTARIYFPTDQKRFYLCYYHANPNLHNFPNMPHGPLFLWESMKLGLIGWQGLLCIKIYSYADDKHKNSENVTCSPLCSTRSEENLHGFNLEL